MSEKIKKIVNDILLENNILSFPIPLKKILKQYNIALRYSELEDNVSGFLYKKGSQQIISVNIKDSTVRQNFTIAHELGHFFLNHQGNIFIDKGPLFRDSNSSEGNIKWERDANKFAAELLMPEAFLSELISDVEIDDFEELDIIANKIKVSTQALTYRLMNLNLVTYF